VSVVDAPPGMDFAGPAAGEFRARTRPKRLARFVFFACLVDGVITYLLAQRNFYSPGTTILFVGPLFCLSIAGVGYAIRSARIRVDEGGVHWGWQNMGFRLGKARIQNVRYFDGALAIEAKRGSVWYLSKYDWERYNTFPRAFEKAKLPLTREGGRAPLRARLQGYGVVLDALMVGALFGSALLLFYAAVR